MDLALAPEAHCRDAMGRTRNCQLGDTIFIGFTNLREWMNAEPDRNRPKDLVLVLDGRVMKGLTPRGPDTQYKELAFDLRRLDGDQPDSKENRDTWNVLLSRSKGTGTMSVGVALGGNPPNFGAASITFQTFPSYSWIVVIFLLVLLALFLLLAYMSDILRDAGPDPGARKRLSFSLARCQMAWWFFIIVGAYNYIWMVTGDHDSLTSGALILMGISAATGLGAVVVDSSKRDQRQSLQNEQTLLTARLAALATAIAAAPANLTDLQAEQEQKKARLAEVITALNDLPSPPGPSDGFLLDILRDETGVSFHRFQMAAWTVVLGFVFVISVYRTLAMPDFSATLLGLMGIGAGTYIGFKIPNPPK
ncbi:MAG: hypothetical protein HY235_04275 [Acidobacteria bacterium]|nr:hypothetical protein [Acidobacteriota bacterium]